MPTSASSIPSRCAASETFSSSPSSHDALDQILVASEQPVGAIEAGAGGAIYPSIVLEDFLQLSIRSCGALEDFLQLSIRFNIVPDDLRQDLNETRVIVADVTEAHEELMRRVKKAISSGVLETTPRSGDSTGREIQTICMPTIIEPFRIKTVEPIHMTTAEQREDLLIVAGYNLFRLPAQSILIDLLTDSGTGAMSAEQWAAIMRGDESYAGSVSFGRFEQAVKDIFGFEHVIPTHQGRAAERILAATVCRPGHVVPNNTHFDTTRANIEAAGAVALDLPCAEARVLGEFHPFKGNIDLALLEQTLDREKGNVPFAMITVTNNGGGGQPVSMDNIKGAAALCRNRGVPLYLDACRFAENAYFIQQRSAEYAQTPLLDIAREMFSQADGCTMSAKKDGMANIGGFLCGNDDALARHEEELLILTEGFPTYGGLAGRDLEAIAVGLYEALDPNYQKYRHASTRYLGERISAAGVPIVQPPGGHAIYIDAAAMLSHLPPEQYPGQALAIELFRHGGIRSVEIGSVMMGKRNPVTGDEIAADNELVRLAIPRRVYTQSHIDYVVESIVEVHERRERIRGVRILEQPEALRHFSAVFEPL